ncbi:MAG: MarR family transcriptional regulator [Cellulosilyticum sp.]|nr:MarR family transcriptional regulator [Cellulosilyticum sp.]
MINRFETFIMTMNQINRSIQTIKSREMSAYGLKGTHVMCLYQLKQNPEGLTATELASLCEEDKAAISRSLSKIESQELITFTDVEGKKRYRTIITLTEKGSKVCDQISQKIDELVQLNSKGISDEEREVFYRVFAVIADNLNAISKDEQ